MYDFVQTLNEFHAMPILLACGAVLLVIDYFFETDIPCQFGYFCFAAALFLALPLSMALSLGVALGCWILLVILHIAWFHKWLN